MNIYSTTPHDGLAPARIIYSYQLYEHGKLDTQAAPPSTRVRKAMDGWRHEPVILDLEAPNHPVPGNAGQDGMSDAMVRGAQLRATELIEYMHRRWPGIKIGCYGCPLALSSSTLNDGLADLGRLLTSDLADAVDAWYPTAYHYGDISQCKGWADNLSRTVAAVSHTGKPARPFVNPYHRGDEDGELISLGVWRDMLGHIRDLGVEPVLWEHPRRLIPAEYTDVMRGVFDA